MAPSEIRREAVEHRVQAELANFGFLMARLDRQYREGKIKSTEYVCRRRDMIKSYTIDIIRMSKRA